MFEMTLRPAVVLAASCILFGCQTPGQNLQANVYKAGEVNTAQEAKVVNILAVMPARIEADNTQQKQGAMVLGGVLGAVGGGIIGNKLANYHPGGTAVGALGGGAAGAMAGSLVSDTVLVDGVSITYEFQGKTLNSAQVGRLCEYAPGKAVVISTNPTETRIQPNATCPAKSN
jgi:outer membrane lipoprotein SlyB